MKKTELKNCPQWLLDANTENEDVDFDRYGILIWRGGDFLGGNFRGGNFWGGNFRGGNFLGGDFLGGDFLGGNFWGGNFRGGNFLGGDFWGGDFLGGNFRGGDFRGESLSRAPISIFGLQWFVICTPKNLHIGCQHHSHEKWKSFNDAQIKAMADGASEFWHNNKAFLLSICDHEAQLSGGSNEN